MTLQSTSHYDQSVYRIKGFCSAVRGIMTQNSFLRYLQTSHLSVVVIDIYSESKHTSLNEGVGALMRSQ